jgi:peptidoglycan/xylan/chitin deacetylase (PgdA/CDA1 family)
MTRAPKLAVYRLCRTLGLFAVARFVTRRGLRILCYHGFSFADESEFRPGLFIRAGTFEGRLRHLEAHGYPILTLEHASRLLARGGLPPNAVVITIDDGFYGVLKLAAPMLKRHEFPATLYVTSYYALKGTPVFRLAVQYIFWKTTAATLDTAGLGLPLQSAVVSVPGPECERRMWEIIHFGETTLGEAERVALTGKLATRLGVDYAAISSSRCFSLMTPGELRGLETSGIDIQLHTHRHHLPDQEQQVSREIVDNRAFMEPLAASGLTHFCYPSGVWSRRQWPW